MPKEEKPPGYEQRIQDTKGLAQRINLSYQGLRNPFRDQRVRLTLLAPVVACLAIVPFFFKRTKSFYENGPVSRAHRIFESECKLCHAQAFTAVSDNSCKTCHDGPVHQAHAKGEARCAACHVEHRDNLLLAQVADRNCTRCHSDISAHADGRVKLRSAKITSFGGDHPEFPATRKTDERPLKLNHFKHLEVAKTVRGIKLPVENCGKCHETDPKSPKGDLLPVNFDKHCRSCHRRELEFDVTESLGDPAPVVPHNRDPALMHEIILHSYRELLNARQVVSETWLATTVAQSETFLFQRCAYCHESEPAPGGYPKIRKVNPIRGRYVSADPPRSEDWFTNAESRSTAEFTHRAHRAVRCESCHQEARKSQKTSDVLIPKRQSCLPCHGSTGTMHDNCAQCHLYHDKRIERERDRRPVQELISLRPRFASRR